MRKLHAFAINLAWIVGIGILFYLLLDGFADAIVYDVTHR